MNILLWYVVGIFVGLPIVWMVTSRIGAKEGAAVSAHTYDTNISNYTFDFSVFAISHNFGPVTPNIYGNWFAGNNGGGAGNIVNFYNTNDYALAQLHWQLDQLSKPDANVLEGTTTWTYSYTGSTNDLSPWNNFIKTSSSTTVGFFITTSLNDRYEVMSYAAQSYTTALGATPATAHLTGSIDLTRQTSQIWPADTSTTDPTKKYAAHFWHSAEFRGDNALQGNYWNELLGAEAFNLK